MVFCFEGRGHDGGGVGDDHDDVVDDVEELPRVSKATPTPAKCSLFTLISVKEKVFVCLTKNTFLPLAAAPAVAVVVDDVVVASS